MANNPENGDKYGTAPRKSSRGRQPTWQRI